VPWDDWPRRPAPLDPAAQLRGQAGQRELARTDPSGSSTVVRSRSCRGPCDTASAFADSPATARALADSHDGRSTAPAVGEAATLAEAWRLTSNDGDFTGTAWVAQEEVNRGAGLVLVACVRRRQQGACSAARRASYMRTTLSVLRSAWRFASARPLPTGGLVQRSDRGSEYTSIDTQTLTDHGELASVGRSRGRRRALAESFVKPISDRV
jgi:hypothetical protein